VSLQESLDATTATGRLMMNLLASVSQWEREVIGERTRDAMKYLKGNSKVYSRPIFGYAQDGSKLTTDPQDIKALEFMQAWRSEGLSYHKIADELNLMGLATKRGGKWQANTVRRILGRAA
jgi:site-specific DNA recombinase